MITKKIGKHYLCYDAFMYKNNPELQVCITEKLPTIFENFSESIILVLGGDGTLLKAIHKHYKKQIPFLGFNFGTRGVLLNQRNTLENISNFHIQNYPLLEVSYVLDATTYRGVCFNEANITVGDGKVLDLEVSIGKEKHLLRGDGVLIATPAGSTGYNRSLLGPILQHSEQKFIMTPKAEMDLKKSVIFENTQTVGVKNIHRLNPIEIYLDGNKLGENIIHREVEVKIRKSEVKVALIKNNCKI